MINLRGLHQAPDLLGALPFGVLGGLLGLLSVFGVELGVIIRELFQLDQEVSDVQLESSDIAAETEETLDELSDLDARFCQLVIVKEDAKDLLTLEGSEKRFVANYQ